MRTVLSQFSEPIRTLHDLLQLQYSKRITRKKSKITNRKISQMESSHQTALKIFLKLSRIEKALALPNFMKRLCLFTKAFSTHLAGVLPQAEKKDLLQAAKVPQDWKHETTAFVPETPEVLHIVGRLLSKRATQ